jgi:hypothetical protein
MEHVMKNISDLAAAINVMLADETVPATPGRYITDGYASDRPESINEIVYLAEELLIKNDGRPNFAEHEKLAAHGFRVSRGESDSFGWLSGVITTPKGLIVYG